MSLKYVGFDIVPFQIMKEFKVHVIGKEYENGIGHTEYVLYNQVEYKFIFVFGKNVVQLITFEF